MVEQVARNASRPVRHALEHGADRHGRLPLHHAGERHAAVPRASARRKLNAADERAFGRPEIDEGEVAGRERVAMLLTAVDRKSPSRGSAAACSRALDPPAASHATTVKMECATGRAYRRGFSVDLAREDAHGVRLPRLYGTVGEHAVAEPAEHVGIHLREPADELERRFARVVGRVDRADELHREP